MKRSGRVEGDREEGGRTYGLGAVKHNDIVQHLASNITALAGDSVDGHVLGEHLGGKISSVGDNIDLRLRVSFCALRLIKQGGWERALTKFSGVIASSKSLV
jgi:hypothetical protein